MWRQCDAQRKTKSEKLISTFAQQKQNTKKFLVGNFNWKIVWQTVNGEALNIPKHLYIRFCVYILSEMSSTVPLLFGLFVVQFIDSILATSEWRLLWATPMIYVRMYWLLISRSHNDIPKDVAERSHCECNDEYSIKKYMNISVYCSTVFILLVMYEIHCFCRCHRCCCSLKQSQCKNAFFFSNPTLNSDLAHQNSSGNFECNYTTVGLLYNRNRPYLGPVHVLKPIMRGLERTWKKSRKNCYLSKLSMYIYKL